jgi:hypothetical protein
LHPALRSATLSASPKEAAMNPGTRACVATAALMAINGKNVSSVYDYSASEHRNVGGQITGKNVSIYDYQRSCHFSGSLPSLYDYGTGNHVQLTVSGKSFNGYDYDTGNHFSGHVTGNSVSIYDYEDSQNYSYSE